MYDLVSFVVHCGVGLNRGHYVSVVKSNGFWFLFDDEQVEVSRRLSSSLEGLAPKKSFFCSLENRHFEF